MDYTLLDPNRLKIDYMLLCPSNHDYMLLSPSNHKMDYTLLSPSNP
jgi:hypothetical protein